ncbi:hypothetical protein HMPREF9061_00527 [Actinomyces sp. oral taxon 181 str. F0379]|nr:hypothetical protein HMPREF9061_00527 [Actinomyces sp. oral taxon 181 str. F0379]
MYPVNESPEHAVGRCLDFWNRFGARGETPGYREELALHGWTGTEIIIGSDLKELLWSGISDDWVNIAPRLFPQKLKRSMIGRNRILVAARRASAEGEFFTELYCTPSDIIANNDSILNDVLYVTLHQFEEEYQSTGLLRGGATYFYADDLPKDHFLETQNIYCIHRDVKRRRKGKI